MEIIFDIEGYEYILKHDFGDEKDDHIISLIFYDLIDGVVDYYADHGWDAQVKKVKKIY